MAKSKPNKKKTGTADEGSTGGETSLRTLVADLRKQTIIGNEDQVATNFILTNISNNIADMTEGIISIKEIMVGNHMKSLETDRENAMMMERLLDALKNKKEEKVEKKEKESFSWLGLAGSLISGLIAGGMTFVATYIAEYIKLWKKVLGNFKIAEKFDDLAKFFGEKWAGLKQLVSDGFTRMWTSVKTFFKENSIVQKVVGFFDDIVKSVKSFFKVDEIIPELKIVWQSLKDIFGGPIEKIANLFKGAGGGFMEGFMKMFTFFEPIMNLFKTLGRIIGKIAVPIQIIMSIFDTVTGALDGWNKTEGGVIDKLFGAIKGGLTGLLNGLFGGLLDLVKDMLSWVLDFFGFKDAAAWLDSFSFSKIIEDTIGGIIDGFKNIVLGVVYAFNKVKDFFTNIDWSGMIKNAMAWLVVGLTAGANSITEGLTGWSLTKKALDLAGLPDPRGGGDGAKSAAPAPTPAAPTQSSGTKQLSSATTENSQGKTEQAAAAAAVATTAAANSGRSATVVQNNSGGSGPGVVISSKTTKWDPEDSWARGGMAFMGA